MKKLLCILLFILILFSLTACTDTNNKDALSSEIVINLPKGNSVNGYRINSDYTQGDIPDIIPADKVTVNSNQSTNDTVSIDYCGNKNSKIFHKSDCNSVSSMKDSNKYYADRKTLINNGYEPCGKCKP